MTGQTTVDAPLILHRETVQPAWIDYNGHMNVAYYLLVFDHASDALAGWLGIDEAYTKRTNQSIFVVEAHVTYAREVLEGDLLRIETQMLGADAKRLHLCHRMFHDHDGYLAATNELMLLHVDLGARRSAPMPDDVRARLDAAVAAHAGLPRPLGLSRTMGL
jgi:acyl-CoA thioester hydrolase